MWSQCTWTRLRIVTLVAFERLFSTVRFHMPSQIACLCGCKTTLVAFVWLLSSVCFHMFPQSVCLSKFKATLVGLVWLLSSVCFHMSPQIARLSGFKATLVALVWPSFCHFNISFYNVGIIIFKTLLHHCKQRKKRGEGKGMDALPQHSWYLIHSAISKFLLNIAFG